MLQRGKFIYLGSGVHHMYPVLSNICGAPRVFVGAFALFRGYFRLCAWGFERVGGELKDAHAVSL